MQVGDPISADHDGCHGTGIIHAVAGDRIYVWLSIRHERDWTSTITHSTAQAGCPLSYMLWLPASAVTLDSW